MTLNEFVALFAEQFEDTPEEQFSPAADFKNFDEWGSLASLSIIAMVEDEMGKSITGADLRSVTTIEELFHLIEAK